MPATWTHIPCGDERMEAYVASPASSGPHPAVIVVQEIWGVNGYIQSVANRLAAQGFLAVAPSLFHREGAGVLGLFEETELAFERLDRMKDEEILDDLRATERFLCERGDVDPDHLGIVGFCVGGRIAYLAASNLENLTTAVNFYGGRSFVAFGEGLSPFEQTANVRIPLLGLFGEDDLNPTPSDVARIAQELEKYNKDFEFHVYPGAGHAFNCEERPTYRRDAALHAWDRAITWFNRYLRE